LGDASACRLMSMILRVDTTGHPAGQQQYDDNDDSDHYNL
jgi:hypothetical protein